MSFGRAGRTEPSVQHRTPRRKGAKRGTNNAKQAAKRDAAAAKREARLPTIAEESPEPTLETPETLEAPRKKQHREGSTWQEQALQMATICCPLDSNLFSDLEYSIKQHVAMTCHLDKGDPRRFLVGNQTELSQTLRRCWQIALTSERIVCDIKRWKRALVLIIKAEGAKVPELDNRCGRRATREIRMHTDAAGAVAALHAKWDRYV